MPAQQLIMQDIVCTCCADVITEDNMTDDNLSVCQNCVDDHVGYCEYCGYHYMNDSSLVDQARSFGVQQFSYMRYDIAVDICSDCVRTCEHCDSEYTNEEDAWECCPPLDEEDDAEGRLHNYGFRPAFKFWSVIGTGVVTYSWHPRPGEFYMGLEVEVEKARAHVGQMVEDDSTENWYNPSFYYWKSDGSLSYRGAELVTMPATLEAHRKMFPFAGLSRLHEQGARAWGYQSCGMHIHVSRSAFTAPHMWKFIKFHLNNASTLAAIAGRDSQQWASWGNDTMVDAREKTGLYVKHDRQAFVNRYSALNFNNTDTVELRYFRSNIAQHGIMRNIELVHAIWAYTKNMTVADYLRTQWSFDAFVEWMQERPSDYSCILEYLKREGRA